MRPLLDSPKSCQLILSYILLKSRMDVKIFTFNATLTPRLQLNYTSITAGTIGANRALTAALSLIDFMKNRFKISKLRRRST